MLQQPTEGVSPPYTPPPPRVRPNGTHYRVETTNPLPVSINFAPSAAAIDAGPVAAYAYICAVSYITRTGEGTVSAAIFGTLANWSVAGCSGIEAAERAVEGGLLRHVKGGYQIAE